MAVVASVPRSGHRSGIYANWPTPYELRPRHPQRPAIEPPGLGKTALIHVQHGQTVQERGHVRMALAELFLAEGKCLAEDGLGLTVPPRTR